MLSRQLYVRLDNFVDKIWDGEYRYDIDNVRSFMRSTMCPYPQYTAELALSQKRSGDYESSIKNYLDVLEGSASVHFVHALPPGILRDMAKVLMAENEYFYAYSILLSLYKVLSDYEDSLNRDAAYLLEQTSIDIVILGRCAKNFDINTLFRETAGYSGNKNYSFPNSQSKINEELNKINTINKSNGLYNHF